MTPSAQRRTSIVIVNCVQVDFRSTLGVAHFTLSLAEELAAEHSVTVVVKNLDELAQSDADQRIRGFASEVVDEATMRQRPPAPESVELLAHHFQPAEFGRHSIGVCHDLHVFDVPWKYGSNVTAMQGRLRRAVASWSAVITHFPRTFYALERVAGVSLEHLYLVDSPLMLDTNLEVGGAPRPETAAPVVLYPAQLQRHKNHQQLIAATATLAQRGDLLEVLCPGSDFDPAFTAELRATVEREGVADRFRFLGRVTDDELVTLYHRADAVIAPSLAEGGAYVPLEAIAAGLPVAAHRLESAQMHARSVGAHIHWFDGTSAEQTADALFAIAVADRHVWWERNERCRERLRTTTWRSVADDCNALIAMVRGETRRPVMMVSSDASQRRIVPGQSIDYGSAVA